MHIEYDLELFVVHKEMFMFSGIFRNCRWMWRVCTKTHKHWSEFHIDVYDIVIIKYSADNNGIGADKHSILASHHIIISGRKKGAPLDPMARIWEAQCTHCLSLYSFKSPDYATEHWWLNYDVACFYAFVFPHLSIVKSIE